MPHRRNLLAIALLFASLSSAFADIPQQVMRQSWNVYKISRPTKRGSGCYIGSGIVVSCEHVARGAKTATCVFSIGADKTESIQATVIGADSCGTYPTGVPSHCPASECESVASAEDSIPFVSDGRTNLTDLPPDLPRTSTW